MEDDWVNWDKGMKYFRRQVCREPEEISRNEFWAGIYGQFMFEDVNHIDRLLRSGQKLVGTTHMFWVEED
jgi:hypothetical protein